jgi:geranylgeranyl reductase family protein
MIETAVVGGGPSGSYCAYCLAGNNHYPVIFDHTHPREKPCGGLVTPFTQRLFPFLKRLPIKHGKKSRLRLIPPSGRQVYLSSRKGEFRSFSRLKLDQFLVNVAVDKGAELIKEKVVALERKKDFWKVKTTRQFYDAKILIGADGVNSLVRRSIIGPLRKVDKGVCCGYLVRGLENEDITIRFLERRKGYMWVIPRDDQTSLGIGTFEASRSHGLRRELDIFIEQQYPNVQIVSKWAALVPNVKNFKTLRIPVAGLNWILIGDAAGHVNPITGEGIVYALLDGELAAKAVVENKPERFNELWKEAYGISLFIDVTLRKVLYTKPGLELLCEFLKLQNTFVP